MSIGPLLPENWSEENGLSSLSLLPCESAFVFFESVFAELTKGAGFAQWFGRVRSLVDHSSRQFFTVRL